MVVAKGVNTLKREWLQCRLENADKVPLMAWEELDDLYAQLLALHQQILKYEGRKEEERGR